MRKIGEDKVNLARSTTPQGSSDLPFEQPKISTWGNKEPSNPMNLEAAIIGDLDAQESDAPASRTDRIMMGHNTVQERVKANGVGLISVETLRRKRNEVSELKERAKCLRREGSA